MVSTVAAVSVVASVLSTALLIALLLRVRTEVRERDAKGALWILVGVVLVGIFGAVRTVQSLGPLTSGPVYLFRNTLFAVGLGLALAAALRLPDVTQGQRNAAYIVTASAVPIVFLVPFWPNLFGFHVGMGALAALCALAAWRLAARPAAPGIRGLALGAAAFVVFTCWLEVLLYLGNSFLLSRWTTDAAIVVASVFPLGAMAEARRAGADTRARALEATQP